MILYFERFSGNDPDCLTGILVGTGHYALDKKKITCNMIFQYINTINSRQREFRETRKLQHIYFTILMKTMMSIGGLL